MFYSKDISFKIPKNIKSTKDLGEYSTAVILYLPIKRTSIGVDINESIKNALQIIGKVTAQIKINLELNKLKNYRLAQDIELYKDLLELLFNALHFGYGKIFIRSHLSSDKKFAIVEFFDNGQGFSKEEMKHAFDKGFTTRAIDNGNGLYYLKEDIDKIKGEIKIISRKRANSSNIDR